MHIHSKDVDDYRNILLNLKKINFKIDKEQVYEYYFMKNIYNTENMFLKNYNLTINEIGGYDKQFTSIIYYKWLEEWTEEKHDFILKIIKEFIESNDFRINHKHLGYHN